MKIRALITDLDNTLYDWVTFFAHAFEAMLLELTTIIGVDRETLQFEFKAIHQRYGSTETPWAALALPSARAKFPGASQVELAQHLDPAFKAFSNARKRHLRLYNGVGETLKKLHEKGIVIIGHTEALPANAFYRLQLLGIVHLFSRLYTIQGDTVPNPFPERIRSFPREGLITTLPSSERKPTPAVLVDISRREKLSLRECVYVGDSLAKDVAMAKQAGTTAVWARYGTRYDPALWDLIVRVTHWTSADVTREGKLRELSRGVNPDFTIDHFNELISICRLSRPQTGTPARRKVKAS